ncbi:MAG: STAS domain-containing protein [Gammaproteobacteria bacterium]|nr:STAS domain-containing protein [Gammaproteobacteria bacterium]
MQFGQILVGAHQGVYIIKLVGDVRLDLCESFAQFIDEMFQRNDFRELVFDLHEAEGIDSTILGLSARAAQRALKHSGQKPMALGANKSIQHLLQAMSFDSLIEISDRPQNHAIEVTSLVCKTPDEKAARTTVLEAHRVLMDMSEHNINTFRTLVRTLEQDTQTDPSEILYTANKPISECT